MASSRPVSMIIPSGIFDEGNNGSKVPPKKETSNSPRPSNPVALPIHRSLINVHSSTSSIDSTGAKNLTQTESPSRAPLTLTATTSTTTTDSEYESEQDNDDNNSSLKSTDLPNPSSRQATPKPVTSKTDEQLSRRVKHFRKLFKSEFTGNMPELIDSYVCAYQGDILLQGKMYITDRFLCFHSRIISYVTKHVHPWEQISLVSKERVAYIFPTAIGIKLKSPEKKLIYASFLQREQAYEKIHAKWAQLHPDDDEHRSTLKSNRHPHSSEKSSKKGKGDLFYEQADHQEQDDVLQLCLPSNKNHSTNKDKRRTRPDDDQSGRLSSNKKVSHSSDRTSTTESNGLSNETNTQSVSTRMRTSYQRSASKPNESSRLDQSSSTNERTAVPPTTTVITSHSSGLLSTSVRLVLLSIISVFKLLINYVVILWHQWRAHPMKLSLLLLLFVGILIVHSFYLIKLAYRIEYRLQSLYHIWPSSASTPVKNSLPSSAKEFL